MAKRKKRGRPPKKAKDRRSKPATLRLTPSEHKQLLADARAAGMSISGYLIKCWKEIERR